MRTLPTALLCALLAAACSREPPAVLQPPIAAQPAQPVPNPSPPHAMPVEATATSLARDHSSIRYRTYGHGDPVVVLIHGWSCDSGYWDSQLDELAVHHTVVTLDLAGHGKSDARKRKDWSMENFGSDVAAVVNATGSSRVVLVGHSMGGAVALEAARQLPGKVLGIVGVDTLRDLPQPYPATMTGPVLKAMRADFARATADFAERNFFTAATDPILRKWIVKDMASAPPRVAIPALEHLLTLDYGPVVRDLDLPIVAINADAPPTDEAAIRALEPRFRVVTMAGVGHFLMMEKPALFNRMLLAVVDAWTNAPGPEGSTLSDPSRTR